MEDIITCHYMVVAGTERSESGREGGLDLGNSAYIITVILVSKVSKGGKGANLTMMTAEAMVVPLSSGETKIDSALAE